MSNKSGVVYEEIEKQSKRLLGFFKWVVIAGIIGIVVGMVGTAFHYGLQYVTEYRIGKACELLRQTKLPVTEVGIQCGFASSSYFGKVFREKIGCSPREYRTKD